MELPLRPPNHGEESKENLRPFSAGNSRPCALTAPASELLQWVKESKENLRPSSAGNLQPCTLTATARSLRPCSAQTASSGRGAGSLPRPLSATLFGRPVSAFLTRPVSASARLGPPEAFRSSSSIVRSHGRPLPRVQPGASLSPKWSTQELWNSETLILADTKTLRSTQAFLNSEASILADAKGSIAVVDDERVLGHIRKSKSGVEDERGKASVSHRFDELEGKIKQQNARVRLDVYTFRRENKRLKEVLQKRTVRGEAVETVVGIPSTEDQRPSLPLEESGLAQRAGAPAKASQECASLLDSSRMELAGSAGRALRKGGRPTTATTAASSDDCSSPVGVTTTSLLPCRLQGGRPPRPTTATTAASSADCSSPIGVTTSSLLPCTSRGGRPTTATTVASSVDCSSPIGVTTTLLPSYTDEMQDLIQAWDEDADQCNLCSRLDKHVCVPGLCSSPISTASSADCLLAFDVTRLPSSSDKIGQKSEDTAEPTSVESAATTIAAALDKLQLSVQKSSLPSSTRSCASSVRGDSTPQEEFHDLDLRDGSLQPSSIFELPLPASARYKGRLSRDLKDLEGRACQGIKTPASATPVEIDSPGDE